MPPLSEGMGDVRLSLLGKVSSSAVPIRHRRLAGVPVFQSAGTDSKPHCKGHLATRNAMADSHVTRPRSHGGAAESGWLNSHTVADSQG